MCFALTKQQWHNPENIHGKRNGRARTRPQETTIVLRNYLRDQAKRG